MASTITQTPQAMRLNIPDFRPRNTIRLESTLDGEETHNGGIPEEDVQSMVGVSIGRAQTRLMSPTTPAAEKAAAINMDGADGFFDYAVDNDQSEGSSPGLRHEGSQGTETPGIDNEACEESSSPKSPSILPSPWVSGPKTFEKNHVQQQQPQRQTHRPRSSTGPFSMLVDLNVKRFVSSINLPSLPKGPTIKDISLPSISTFLGPKEHSQVQNNELRQESVSTPTSLRSSPINDRFPHQGSISFGAAVQGQSEEPCLSNGHKRKRPSLPVQKTSQADSANPDPNQSEEIHLGPNSLRRATSDQSLQLRRAASMVSSLGDDSRWEHVQKQVNSRAKAITDSLQDSSIKLPSLPSLPSVNLSSLRPDFLRNRAASESKKAPDGLQKTSSPNLAWDKSKSTSRLESMANDEPKPVQRSSKITSLQLDEALEHLTGDVVVLGGYRGSILRSAKAPHRQLWAPVKVGLNVRKVNLEVGLEPYDEENMENTIIPSGMLSHIGPVDMGRRLLKRLNSCRNAQEGRLRIHDYGYDWRLSPHLLSRRLVAFLEDLPSNKSHVAGQAQGATVIAHSMGGLITRHAVNQRPELFSGVVFAGVPQHCVNILGPLRNGDEVLLSSKVLTAQVNFTLRSSYLLLPEDGKCFIDKQTKEDYPVNFFDVAEWTRYAFSPCIAPASPPFTTPEKKSLLSSVTDSLPSLPLVNRKSSVFRNPPASAPTSIVSSKIDDLTHPTLDPHFDHQSSHSTISPQCTIPLPAATAYLTRTLAATLQFRRELEHNPSLSDQNRYPPFAVLYSNSTPTVSRAKVACREAIKCSDAYDDLAFGSGDGVCLARAAMLPKGYVCSKGGRVKTERGHVGLLGDLEAVGRCLNAIREARKRGVGLGQGNEKLVQVLNV